MSVLRKWFTKLQQVRFRRADHSEDVARRSSALDGAQTSPAPSVDPLKIRLRIKRFLYLFGLLYLIFSVGWIFVRSITRGVLLDTLVNGIALVVVATFLTRMLADLNQANLRHKDALRVTEDELDQQGVTLRAVLSSSAIPLFIMDERGKTIYANPASETLFGYQENQLIGLYLHDLLHTNPDGTKTPIEDCEIAKRYIAGETFTDVEDVFVARSGEPIRVSISVSPIKRDGNLEGSIVAIQDIRERHAAEKALRDSAAGLRSLIRHAPIGITRIKFGQILEANPAFISMLGYSSEEEVKALNPAKDLYVDLERRAEILHEFETHDWVMDAPVLWKRSDGKHIRVLLTGHCVTSRANPQYEVFTRDITEQEQLQSQLFQSRKMEAIGLLAGGIAHDFNNLLSVIGLNSELALAAKNRPEIVEQRVGEITTAADRASVLTSQLLAYSRNQRLEFRIVDLNLLVQQFVPIVRRMIGEQIQVETNLTSANPAVRVDPTQIDQVLLNLAVNSRDAMASGGRLVIDTSDVLVDADHARMHPGLSQGRYVVMAVSDDGCGMDEATKSRIFDPFFTTKEIGKGTGLGLSTVYGIVKQCDGYISVYSQLGKGATFKVYLPQQNAKPEQDDDDAVEQLREISDKTVLVVEDEVSLGEVIAAQLESAGFRVLTARDGKSALNIVKEEPRIDLLLTDVVLTGMNGRRVADAVRKVRPKLKILFMSGYAANLILDGGSEDEPVNFISKPFSRTMLLSKIAEVLGTRKRKIREVEANAERE